jgi:hypothetical protein
MLAADLDGDGVTDVLSGFNLFHGHDDGSFTCTVIQNGAPYGERVFGPMDLDGDGALDLITGSIGGSPTLVDVIPVYSRGGAYVAGAWRIGALSFTAEPGGLRAGLFDADGDGVRDRQRPHLPGGGAAGRHVGGEMDAPGGPDRRVAASDADDAHAAPVPKTHEETPQESDTGQSTRPAGAGLPGLDLEQCAQGRLLRLPLRQDA